jgi:hypothetical protein
MPGYGLGYSSLVRRSSGPGGPSYGTLTTAWITATGETDTTILGALNTLESDLTTYGLTSKMKALYPMVGGTAAKHKFNFMDAQDTDAAFRLVFSGGWTHSSTGALPNGTNAYADTKFNGTLFTQDNAQISVYSRTNSDGLFCDIGYVSSTTSDETNLFSKYVNVLYPRIQGTNLGVANSVTSAGLMMANRTSSTIVKGIRNTVITSLSNNSFPKGTSTSDNIFIGALNRRSLLDVVFYSPREYALASLGDGLTDTEAANFYTAVQTFQTTLGRQVGVPIVSDSDAQAFLNAAVITDTTQATAVNNLVIGLKADSLWTKMAAIYPFVGGTATAHSYNLKNTAQYQLTFSGGWTHASTGATCNGVNAYADTGLNQNSVINLNSNGITTYGEVVSTSPSFGYSGLWGSSSNYSLIGFGFSNTFIEAGLNVGAVISFGTNYNRMVTVSRQNSTTTKLYKNGSAVITSSTTPQPLINGNYWIGGLNNSGSILYPYNVRMSLFSIHDGLNDTEAANLYTRVQTYQTALSRNV